MPKDLDKIEQDSSPQDYIKTINSVDMFRELFPNIPTNPEHKYFKFPPTPSAYENIRSVTSDSCTPLNLGDYK